MEELNTKADRYFREMVELGWDELLAPVPGAAPAGQPAVQDESYARVRHEREEEDASLPLGAWERELKRANWVAAATLSARALATRSKDLQFAAWLFEASLARSGFQALGPCLGLIDALLHRYADKLYPLDAEHRTNVLLWVGSKLLPFLRKAPLTATGGEHEYAWSDWEQARRNEQVRASLGKQAQQEIEGASLNEVGAALASTPYERIAFLQACLSDGLHALDALEQTLDETMHDDAPGFGPMRDLLEDIALTLASEVRRRGITPVTQETEDHADDAQDYEGEHEAFDMHGGNVDRREVYAALASIAHALERIEPHSPVPYLIRRAVAWGGLNTAQLYNEVFVRCGGQINIFELLGLEDQIAQAERAAG